MEIKGRLNQILPVQSGVSKAGNEWKKQEFVVETQDQYPKQVCFTLFGDKIAALNGIQPGTEVNVFFDVESREFNGRWYHNINAWKIETMAAAGNDGPPPFGADDLPPEPMNDGDGDDLPF